MGVGCRLEGLSDGGLQGRVSYKETAGEDVTAFLGFMRVSVCCGFWSIYLEAFRGQGSLVRCNNIGYCPHSVTVE